VTVVNTGACSGTTDGIETYTAGSGLKYFGSGK
jgi:hypothetical protein